MILILSIITIIGALMYYKVLIDYVIRYQKTNKTVGRLLIFIAQFYLGAIIIVVVMLL